MDAWRKKEEAERRFSRPFVALDCRFLPRSEGGGGEREGRRWTKKRALLVPSKKERENWTRRSIKVAKWAKNLGRGGKEREP